MEQALLTPAILEKLLAFPLVVAFIVVLYMQNKKDIIWKDIVDKLVDKLKGTDNVG